MKPSFLFLFCLLIANLAYGQGGISVNTTGTAPDNSAMFDVQSTTKGILIPRMTETQRNAIASPATGLMVYQTDATAGFYYYNGTSWQSIGTASFTETDPKVGTLTTNYLPKWNGTTLANGLLFDNGTNVGIGTTSPTYKLDVSSTFNNTGRFNSSSATGTWLTLNNSSTGGGEWNLISTGTSNSEGSGNLLFQNGAVRFMINSAGNVGIGTTSPSDKLHVVGNTRIDAGRLDFRNTGGSIFIGKDTGLNDDLVDNYNTFVGYVTGMENTTGRRNNAFGANALVHNTTGNYNNAVGGLALSSNTTGSFNNVMGDEALINNITGSRNVAIGDVAGFSCLGSGNVFIGFRTGYSETGSDKLYIDNSNTTSPLIYGEFDNNLLRVNGTLNVNNAYSLPTVAGSANQVLQTNGAGVASWVNASALPTFSGLTTNYAPKWNGSALTNGLLYDNGTNAGIGTTNVATESRLALGALATNEGGQLQLNSGTSGSVAYHVDNFDDNFRIMSGTNTGSSDVRLQISSAGNVGIGTTSITQAKLVVSGSQNYNVGSYRYYNNSTQGGGSGASDYSIYASDRIAASEFNAFSDARIKKVKGITNNANDLATLAKIRITDYTHIDSIAKGNREVKKVIAQELKAVYPQAVSTMTDVVPDIYKQADIENGFVSLPTNLKAGEKVKIIFATGEEVLEVTGVEATGFRVNSDKAGKVFVFGRQVSDFHVVDYEALSTLNISATQELLKKIENLEKEVKTLKVENQEIKTVKAEMTDLKKQMADI